MYKTIEYFLGQFFWWEIGEFLLKLTFWKLITNLKSAQLPHLLLNILIWWAIKQPSSYFNDLALIIPTLYPCAQKKKKKKKSTGYPLNKKSNTKVLIFATKLFLVQPLGIHLNLISSIFPKDLCSASDNHTCHLPTFKRKCRQWAFSYIVAKSPTVVFIITVEDLLSVQAFS